MFQVANDESMYFVVPEVAQRCGLKEQTVIDLLLSGWTFTEKINCVPTWVHPSANLQEKK